MSNLKPVLSVSDQVMALSDTQVRELRAKLEAKHVRETSQLCGGELLRRNSLTPQKRYATPSLDTTGKPAVTGWGLFPEGFHLGEVGLCLLGAVEQLIYVSHFRRQQIVRMVAKIVTIGGERLALGEVVQRAKLVL